MIIFIEQMGKLYCVGVDGSTNAMNALKFVADSLFRPEDKVYAYHAYTQDDRENYETKLEVQSVLLMRVLVTQVPGRDFQLIWERLLKPSFCHQIADFLNKYNCHFYVAGFSQQ
jgi:hypothetical protein